MLCIFLSLCVEHFIKNIVINGNFWTEDVTKVDFHCLTENPLSIKKKVGPDPPSEHLNTVKTL